MDSQTIKLVEMMYYKINLIKIVEFTQFLKSAHTLAAMLDAILNN